MPHPRLCLALLACLLLAVGGRAADNPLPLVTAQGIIDKVDKDGVTVQPRGAEGRFEKSVTLRVTRTSKITTVTSEKRGGKMVPVQRDVGARDLRPKQPVAVIYTDGPDGPVLLAAVVQPAEEK